MKPHRWALSWLCYWIGHLAYSIGGKTGKDWLFDQYQWWMSRAHVIQGPDPRNGPWGPILDNDERDE